MLHTIKKNSIPCICLLLVACNAQGGFLDNMIKDISKSVEDGVQNMKNDNRQIISDINNARKGNHSEKHFIVLTVAPQLKTLVKSKDNELADGLYYFLRQKNFEIEPPWDDLRKYTEQGLALSPDDTRALTNRLGLFSFGYLVVGMPRYSYSLKKRSAGDQYLIKVKIEFLFVPNITASYDLNIKKWSKTVTIKRTVDSRNFEGWEFLIFSEGLEDMSKRKQVIANVSGMITEAFEMVYPSFPMP